MKTVALMTALDVAKLSLGPSDSVLPVFGHFCFTDDDFVYAYNDITAVLAPMESGLHCALHGETLTALLLAAGTEEVKIKLGDHSAKFDVGNGWVEVPLLPPEQFVFQFPDDFEEIISFPVTDEVAQAIELCLLSCDEKNINPVFAGVTIWIKKDGVWFYSTDNATAVRCELQSKFISRKEAAVVVPVVACNQILKLRDKDTKFRIGAKLALLETDRAVLITKLLDANVDMFQNVFSQHLQGGEFVTLPKELGRELSKAAVVLGREHIKECAIACSKKKMEITAAGVLGRMQTTIAAPDGCDEGKVWVDVAHVQRILPYATEFLFNDLRSIVFSNEKGLTYIVASRNQKTKAIAETDEKQPKKPVKSTHTAASFDFEDDIPF